MSDGQSPSRAANDRGRSCWFRSLWRTCAAPLLLTVVGSGCAKPSDPDLAEKHRLTDVRHILTDRGRRVGELTADSLIIADDGNVARGWNVLVKLERAGLQVRADSMSLDWARHEMRYYGDVEITSPEGVRTAENLVISEW